MKKTILYFTNIPSPYRVDFFNLINCKYDLTVLFDDGNDEDRNPLWYENNNFTFKYVNIKIFGFLQLIKILKTKYDFYVIDGFSSINGNMLSFLLKQKGISYFLNIDGGFIKFKESKIEKYIKTKLISNANFYLSSGHETNKYLEYYGANKNNIFIYPFTSLLENDLLDKPLDYSEKVLLRKKLGFDFKKIYITVGRFVNVKAYDAFLSYLPNECTNDDTCYLFVGGGKELDFYKEIVKKRSLKNIFFIDFRSKSDVFDLLKASDVFFFTSLHDVWGLVINEAMAVGLPIISSRTTIASIELLDRRFLFDIYSKEDFLNTFNYIYHLSTDELYGIGKNNLSKIYNYTIEREVETHARIFESI